MDHAAFVAFCRSLLGKVPTMLAREELNKVVSGKLFTIRLQWPWIPTNLIRSDDNPLKRLDGVVLEMGACNDDGITIYVPEEARK